VSVDRLLELLQAYRGEGVWNQYLDVDPALERPDGAAIRRRNLRRYLEAFASASYVLVGEAAGYAGCRFSGMPFTGEAQIVGPECLPWARGLGFEQSSLGELWRERSGEMVWAAFDGRRDCVLWNAFPWHPYGDRPLSNRKPKPGELEQAEEVLRCFLSLYAHGAAHRAAHGAAHGAAHVQVHAIGRVSQDMLGRLGVDAPYIRHPSHGGKTAFERGIRALPRRG
jgi:uracil-DNA glycosylase